MVAAKQGGVSMACRRMAAIGICIGLVITLVAAFAGTGNAQQAKTLKIGSLKAMTGFYSFYDTADAMDIRNVAKMINDKGGLTIKGQKYNIEIVEEDLKSSLEGTTAAATKLAYDKKVKFVVGPAGWFGPAAGAVFNPNKILYVLEFSTGQPGELGPYGFMGGISSITDAMLILAAAKKEFPEAKKLVCVTADDGSVPYLMKGVKKVLARDGFTMVGDVITYSQEMQDMSPIAAKLNAASDADAIFSVNMVGPAFANTLKGVRELGNKKPWIGATVMEGPDIITIAGKSAVTNLITLINKPNAPGNPPIFDEVYNMRTGQRQMYTAFGPSALISLVSVIKAANSIDPDAVKAQWEKMDTVDSLYGKAIVSGDESYGIKHHALGVATAYQKGMNGEVTFRGWVPASPIP